MSEAHLSRSLRTRAFVQRALKNYRSTSVSMEITPQTPTSPPALMLSRPGVTPIN